MSKVAIVGRNHWEISPFMKTIHRRLVLALFVSSATGLIAAQPTAGGRSVPESEVAELAQAERENPNRKAERADETLLSREAGKGNPGAERLLADRLMRTKKDAKSLERALNLFADAAEKGEPGAHVGLAKALLHKAATQSKKDKPVDGAVVQGYLREASARGSAEADRLLAGLLSGSTEKEENAQAWTLLTRAGERGDADACVELADAYLTGNWNGTAIPVNGAEAERLLRKGSDKGSPGAALRLAMQLSAKWIDTTPEAYEESVQQLYRAFLHAYEVDPESLEEIDRLYEEGKIYPRTWMRAHFLFEETIHPKSVETDAKEPVQTLEVKVREGVRLSLTIAGATSGPAYTSLGFPYDEPYLWDGVVTAGEDGRLVVPADDPYWPSACEQLKAGSMPCFVKILDGPYAGLSFNVNAGCQAGEDRSIALEDLCPELFESATKIALGQWRSLFSVFGRYNEMGLRPGNDASDADEIILFDSEKQRVRRYFFNSSLMSWADEDAPDEAATDVALPPWQALFVLHRDEASLYLTISGAKSGVPVSLPVDPGVNLVPDVEGRLLLELDAAAYTFVTIRAEEFPVFRLGNADEKEGLIPLGKESGWWKLLGVSADTPVFMNSPSAFILSEGEENIPILLQR
jgi:TPR repeat protein